MSKVLVFSETKKTEVKSVTLEILGKLKGKHIECVVFGDLSDQSKKQLAEFGAEKIHLLKGDAFKTYSPEGYAGALYDFIKDKDYTHVFAGSTAMGKDFFPRLSAKFESGLASDVTNFLFEGDAFSATRPLYAGKCLAKVEILGSHPHFVTVRPNSLGLPEGALTSGKGEIQETSPEASDIRAVISEIIKGASEKLDLTEANIIVSGGRAMKNSDNFKILHEMADVLGATVGASRAAVDSGYAEPAMQVGQTGKTVSPTLYIACGISGAIQHLAGMRTSKVIVAINTDPDAPIFTKADYGIVGDLFKIVPIMTEELKKMMG